MIFVKDSLNGVDETQVNENGMQVDLELFNFLNQFQDVFIDDIPGELPPKRGDDDHMIELIPGSSPPNKPPYSVSQAQQEEIMRQVNELVEKGMVRPSSSPFCSPVLLVQKKDGTYRMCVDYRALNRITIKNRFLVPRVEDLFDKLQDSTYFSRIDLKSGYHQIRIVDEDIVKTAFRTTFGLYEYLVMPFGLTNAPATFNRMMERIFRPHRNFTGVFFDDVIIYSKTIEEHKEHLKVIFQALRDYKLYVNKKKSEFFLQEIQYLGHIISKNGIRMDPAKLEVIKDWANPRNLHEVRSFIGMCAYYRRFIEKFSLIAGPLHDLTKKNVKYVWIEKRQQAFDTLKQKLISQLVLALPDLSKPFEPLWSLRQSPKQGRGAVAPMGFGAAPQAGSRGGSPRGVWGNAPSRVEGRQPPRGWGQHPKQGRGAVAPTGFGATSQAGSRDGSPRGVWGSAPSKVKGQQSLRGLGQRPKQGQGAAVPMGFGATPRAGSRGGKPLVASQI
ncbi:hypothetical protein L7F22_006782 [Adiantum nelumboides]|nr:hypothetical protein [Adiantum nelumboides]